MQLCPLGDSGSDAKTKGLAPTEGCRCGPQPRVQRFRCHGIIAALFDRLRLRISKAFPCPTRGDNLQACTGEESGRCWESDKRVLGHIYGDGRCLHLNTSVRLARPCRASGTEEVLMRVLLWARKSCLLGGRGWGIEDFPIRRGGRRRRRQKQHPADRGRSCDAGH